MKKRHRALSLMFIVTAGLILAFSLLTDTGTAFMTEMKELFIPKKQVMQNIEGVDEEVEVELNEGKNADYVIYVDETRYKLTSRDTSDIITPVHPVPKNYPEVTMEIKQVQNEKPEILIEKIAADLKKEFSELGEIEAVKEPVIGFKVHGKAGNNADSKIVTVFVISNGKEGSFVITQRYFLEAAEGHGARFHQMLKSFKLIN